MSEPKPAQPPPDLLINEVRQRRRDLYAKYDNDLDKLAEAIQRIEAEHPEKYVDPGARERARSRRASDRS